MEYSLENLESEARKVLDEIDKRYFYEPSPEFTECGMQVLMDGCLKDMVSVLNATADSERGRDLGSIGQALTENGIEWKWNNSLMLVATIDGCQFYIRHILNTQIANTKAETAFIDCKANETDIVNLLKSLAKLRPIVQKMFLAKRNECRKNQIICDIMAASMAPEIDGFLKPRNIEYRLETHLGSTLLLIRIIGMIWMEKEITMDGLARDLDAVTKLIGRPDLVEKGDCGFRLLHING